MADARITTVPQNKRICSACLLLSNVASRIVYSSLTSIHALEFYTWGGVLLFRTSAANRTHDLSRRIPKGTKVMDCQAQVEFLALCVCTTHERKEHRLVRQRERVR